MSLLIDAPFNRPETPPDGGFANPERDRDAYVQLTIDMRRGLDLLLARRDVDARRVAYVGHSLGATWGGALAGVEHARVRAFILMGGLPTLTDFSGDDEFSKEVRSRYSREQLDRYAATVGPIDPEHFVGRAAPARLYFQFPRWDRYISKAAAERYERAASQTETVADL